MRLRELQRDMRAWLAHADVEAARRAGNAAAPGLRVYQNNYRAQLVACLEASYPCVRAWIGDEAFLDAAIAHIDRVPPSSWTLDAYSRDVPETLALLYPGDPEIAELAWLELALDQVFAGPDAGIVTVADLAQVDWDHAVLRVIPALDIGDLTTNVPAIWSALTASETPPAAERLEQPEAMLVWRLGELSRFRAIDRDERQALVQVRAGQSYAALCEAAADAFGEQEGIARAGRWLGRWVSDGLIADIEDGRRAA